MSEYTYKISLRLRHPAIHPTALTAALGVQPSHSGAIGEQRMTTKGTPLKGVHKETFWTARLVDGASVDHDLSAALGRVLDTFGGRVEFFRDFVASGGRAEFFIGWFFDDNSGDVLGHELLARLADFKIDLSLDLYPDTPD